VLLGGVNINRMTLKFNKTEDSEIKAGDFVVSDRMELLKVTMVEPRENGNEKYWFSNGKFGLKNETHLGAPGSFYKKLNTSKCVDALR
jgi:hypothetical protein